MMRIKIVYKFATVVFHYVVRLRLTPPLWAYTKNNSQKREKQYKAKRRVMINNAKQMTHMLLLNLY